jgi:hypothetical protein
VSLLKLKKHQLIHSNLTLTKSIDYRYITQHKAQRDRAFPWTSPLRVLKEVRPLRVFKEARPLRVFKEARPDFGPFGTECGGKYWDLLSGTQAFSLIKKIKIYYPIYFLRV